MVEDGFLTGVRKAAILSFSEKRSPLLLSLRTIPVSRPYCRFSLAHYRTVLALPQLPDPVLLRLLLNQSWAHRFLPGPLFV